MNNHTCTTYCLLSWLIQSLLISFTPYSGLQVKSANIIYIILTEETWQHLPSSAPIFLAPTKQPHLSHSIDQQPFTMIEIPLSAVYVVLAAYAYYFSSLSQFFLLSFAATILKTFYSTVLYPVYFTPLKQVPTPPVSTSDTSRSLIYTRWNISIEPLMDHRQLRIAARQLPLHCVG